MHTTLLDVESVPLPESTLIEMMPDEIRNPFCPDEITNPPAPDLSKCPVYSGDSAKQQAWREKTIRDAQEKAIEARQKWTLAAADAKQKWIGDAALHAPRSTVKLIGLRDPDKGITTLIVIDATPAEKIKIESHPSWPCKVKFVFLDEKGALDYFHDCTGSGVTVCGYYIQGYDLPYLSRRAMIIGAAIPRHLRKGRYWDNDRIVDLDEEYKMGERDLHIGGLKGLSKILGVKQKEGDGENFFILWRNNPIDAINYHLSENLVLEACAKKMGVI